MDYPKSVPNVGLVNGKFVDEDTSTGLVGSLIPSDWGNAVTDEILNALVVGGQMPDETKRDQLAKAIAKISKDAQPVKRFLSFSADTVLTAEQTEFLLLDATASNLSITLPASNAALGVRDVILRRQDNTTNRLVVKANGAEKIKFHTHLNTAGYGFFVLMGAGDWWHLRSDGVGNWWPMGRFDGSPLGRPVFETTIAFNPGGHGALSGAVFNRADWPWLWDHAQQSSMLTTEAARVGMEGGWTSGDGVATFRGPEARGEFIRVLDEARGIDVGRVGGSWATDMLRAHSHNIDSPSNPTGFGSGKIARGNRSDTAGFPGSELNGGIETRPRSIAWPGRIKLI